MDMDVEMDLGFGNNLSNDPYHIDDPKLEGSQYEKQVVLDILDSVLNLMPVSPRLERLAEILAKCQFEGWAHESESKVRNHDFFFVTRGSMHFSTWVFSNKTNRDSDARPHAVGSNGYYRDICIHGNNSNRLFKRVTRRSWTGSRNTMHV